MNAPIKPEGQGRSNSPLGGPGVARLGGYFHCKYHLFIRSTIVVAKKMRVHLPPLSLGEGVPDKGGGEVKK